MEETEIQTLQSLKEVSGLGISECKSALTQSGGDRAKALRDLLGDNKNKMLELAQEERTPPWALEALAACKYEEVVFAVSKNRSTPKPTKENAYSETTAYSNKQNISDHERQIAELRREITQIKKAYNSLLQSLEKRDKEITDLLGQINKSVNQSSNRPANYVTFSLGDF